MPHEIQIDPNKPEAAFGYPPRMFVSNIAQLANDLERMTSDADVSPIDNAPSYILAAVQDGIELRNAQGVEHIEWRDVQPIINHIRASFNE